MTTDTKGKFLGVAMIATRPCGRVAAMAWTDAFSRAENYAKAREWRDRGLTVKRVERFDGDPWPEWATGCKSPCACDGETT